MPLASDDRSPSDDAAARSREGRSFLRHAGLVGAITFLSRIIGLVREQVSAHYFGASPVMAAWKLAFTIPNLFRKLFGEGALSAAFIPLYAQLRKQPVDETSRAFAGEAVRLLLVVLFLLTIVIELLLGAAWIASSREDYRLAIELTAIMLPYVMLVCTAALLSGVLQVHGRFGAAAMTAVVLNVALIVAIVGAARFLDLSNQADQTLAVRWLGVSVLIAGVLQLVTLVPDLRAVGFSLRGLGKLVSPGMRKLVRLTIPVAIGASVLQLGVLLDKGIAFGLSAGPNAETFSVLGHELSYPMQSGAVVRLDLAQFMYQFPLGVFAIALATAIFPKLAGDAEMGTTRAKVEPTDAFRSVLRKGIETALFIGLPASCGMVMVADPAIRLLFQHGQFTPEDATLCARSTAIYSAAIWAFSVQQILNRGFYSLQDVRTPLIWTGINLLLNLVIELPLLWTSLGEAGMAAGTLGSFAIQSMAMTIILSKRVGMPMGPSVMPVMKMIAASIGMVLVCVALDRGLGWHEAETRVGYAVRLFGLMIAGGAVYLMLAIALGLPIKTILRRRRSQA